MMPLALLVKHGPHFHGFGAPVRHGGRAFVEFPLDIVLAILDLNRARGSATANPGMERMLSFVRANLGDPDLCPADIARSGCVSRRTMNRLFGELGTTPMRWVMQERIRLAERYPNGKQARTVTEAALMAGFNDISHFSRSFKQHLGYSPGQILKRV